MHTMLILEITLIHKAAKSTSTSSSISISDLDSYFFFPWCGACLWVERELSIISFLGAGFHCGGRENCQSTGSHPEFSKPPIPVPRGYFQPHEIIWSYPNPILSPQILLLIPQVTCCPLRALPVILYHPQGHPSPTFS